MCWEGWWGQQRGRRKRLLNGEASFRKGRNSLEILNEGHGRKGSVAKEKREVEGLRKAINLFDLLKKMWFVGAKGEEGMASVFEERKACLL